MDLRAKDGLIRMVDCFLKTARLWLRPFVLSDEAALVVALDDITVSRRLTVVPHP